MRSVENLEICCVDSWHDVSLNTRLSYTKLLPQPFALPYNNVSKAVHVSCVAFSTFSPEQHDIVMIIKGL